MSQCYIIFVLYFQIPKSKYSVLRAAWLVLNQTQNGYKRDSPRARVSRRVWERAGEYGHVCMNVCANACTRMLEAEPTVMGNQVSQERPCL